jgi:hypothetical protein
MELMPLELITMFTIMRYKVSYNETGQKLLTLPSQVTNRDECVSIKSPSHHALVENLVCNQVGSGISIGSLNVSAEISNIVSNYFEYD